MQNLDWNKCFQQVLDIGLHFSFVHGLAVGMYLCSPRSDHPGRLGGCAWSREDNYCHQPRLIGSCSNHGLGIILYGASPVVKKYEEVGQMEPCAPIYLTHKSRRYEYCFSSVVIALFMFSP